MGYHDPVAFAGARPTSTGGEIARSIGGKGPACLLLFAVLCGAFDWFVIRQRMVQMSAQGRRQIGQVVASTSQLEDHDRMQPGKPTSVIEVHDPEIGAQLVEQPGRRPLGQRVPVLCATPLGRCVVEEEVREHLARGPITVLNLVGVGSAVLALGWLWALRPRRGQVGG